MPKRADVAVSKPRPTTNTNYDMEGEVDPPAFEQPGELDGDSWYYQPTEDDDKVKILYYAKEGQTKTTCALTAANSGPVMVVNAEGGAKIAPMRDREIDVDNLRFWPKRGEKVTIEGLEAVHRRLLADLLDDPDSWYAVVIDSITEVAAVLTEAATADRIRRILNKGGVAAQQVNRDFVDRDDYGVMTKQLRRVLRNFRDLPCHVVFTGLERFDEETAEFVPDMSPVIRNALLGYVDVSLYLKLGPMQDGGRLWSRALSAGDGYRVKDRFGRLPQRLAEPTFERVLGYLSMDLQEQATTPDEVQIAFEAEIASIAEAEALAEASKPARKTRSRLTKVAAATTTEGN